MVVIAEQNSVDFDVMSQLFVAENNVLRPMIMVERPSQNIIILRPAPMRNGDSLR